MADRNTHKNAGAHICASQQTPETWLDNVGWAFRWPKKRNSEKGEDEKRIVFNPSQWLPDRNWKLTRNAYVLLFFGAKRMGNSASSTSYKMTCHIRKIISANLRATIQPICDTMLAFYGPVKKREGERQIKNINFRLTICVFFTSHCSSCVCVGTQKYPVVYHTQRIRAGRIYFLFRSKDWNENRSACEHEIERPTQ